VEITTGRTESIRVQTISKELSLVTTEGSFGFRKFVAGLFGIFNKVSAKGWIKTTIVVQI